MGRVGNGVDMHGLHGSDLEADCRPNGVQGIPTVHPPPAYRRNVKATR